MNVRLYKEVNFNVLYDIYKNARAPIDCFRSNSLTIEAFELSVEGEEVHVALFDEKIIGFISVWVVDNFIHHLYVHSDQQKKGIARALIQTCVARYGLPLRLKSVVANEQACTFYEYNKWLIKDIGEGPEGPYNLYVLEH